MSLSLSSCCGKCPSLGKNLDISGLSRQCLAKVRDLASLCWTKEVRPVSWQAASYPSYWSCSIIFRLVFCIISIFFSCGWVSELWKLQSNIQFLTLWTSNNFGSSLLYLLRHISILISLTYGPMPSCIFPLCFLPAASILLDPDTKDLANWLLL